MEKHNAWAVQFKYREGPRTYPDGYTDDEWLTQTWHKRKTDAIAEMDNDKHYFGDTVGYRVIPTHFKWR